MALNGLGEIETRDGEIFFFWFEILSICLLGFRRHLLVRLFSLPTNASSFTAALNHAARAQSTARTHPSIHPKSLSGRRCNSRVPKLWELKPPPCKAQLTSSIRYAVDNLTPLQLSISAITKQFWNVSSGGRRPLLSAAT
ncbi:hypothetical protein M0R45_019938 [Rubus argutus]|uniref:Uncharacterized protein n=1 Tax=Rubus argutus TaxID=59490 RepID=A0AAW1XA18_RUBAR